MTRKENLRLIPGGCPIGPFRAAEKMTVGNCIVVAVLERHMLEVSPFGVLWYPY